MNADLLTKPLLWHSVRDELSLLELSDATLTEFASSPLGDRRVAHTGAVYSNGRLVPESCRLGGLGEDLCLHVDPPSLGATCTANDLPIKSGRWLFAGHFMHHFGHFITETLTNLWPSGMIDVDGVVFLPFLWGGVMAPWQLEQVRVLFPNAEILVADRAYMFEKLWVAERPFLPNREASAPARIVWRRLTESALSADVCKDSRPKRVFLSRSRLAQDPRRVLGDEALDEMFDRAGFEVIYPETLDFVDQLRTVASAELLAGLTGSALHLAAFAMNELRVLEVGDRRSPDRGLLTQRAINARLGHRAAYLPFFELSDRRDMVLTQQALRSLLDGIPA